MPFMTDDDDQKELGWEKPAWTKNAGLKKTPKGDAVKQGADLQAPITNLPHLQEDGPFSKPEWTGQVPEEKKIHDPAKPITALPHGAGGKDLSFEKPDWTKKTNLQATKKGEALKSGKEIARPIGGIKPAES